MFRAQACTFRSTPPDTDTFRTDATLLTLLVVDAFVAAAVGRFSNIPLTFGAGIGIGVVARLITKFVPHNQSLAGLPSSLPFVVLFFVLVLSPSGTFPTRLQNRRAYRHAVIPVAVNRVLVVVAAVTVVFVPAMVGAKLPVYTNAATYVTISVSLACSCGPPAIFRSASSPSWRSARGRPPT